MFDSLEHKARKVLLNNYHATGGDYITPSWPHYKNQWLWDSSFHAIAASELGLNDIAKNEVKTLLRFQESNGWIPHRIYHGIYPWFDVERLLYGKGMRPLSSSLVGMPVLAQAVDSINDNDFTAEVAEKLVNFYKYFVDVRDAGNIVTVISPRESGRDASPEFDFFRPRPPKGLKFLDRILDPLYVLKLHLKYRTLKWDIDKIFEKKEFLVKDPVAHCIWLDGMYSLRDMLERTGSTRLWPDIGRVIERGEKALFDISWDEEDRMFYPLRYNKKRSSPDLEKIREPSLGIVFPLLIENLPGSVKDRIVEILIDPDYFWTKYPIPSVPVLHSEFNPSRTFPIWRGPTWLNVNWFLIRALKRHNYNEYAIHIAQKSIEAVTNEGFREFYHPYTGEGMRVRSFGWSTLAVTFRRLSGKE